MNLPTGNIIFPPESVQKEYKRYAQLAAWYSGDPNQLLEYFIDNVPDSDASGRFWKEQKKDEMSTVIHVPLAGDIAGFSADLLFGETFGAEIDGNTQGTERLEEIIQEGGVVDRLLGAAETASALGGVYLKPTWDSEISNFPILSIAQPDNAIPVFKHGFLVGVLFHKVVEVDGNSVYRFLELHEAGRVENALYIGTFDYIGTRVKLDHHSATANEQDEIITQIPYLLPAYVPNRLPNRKLRGSALGASDIDGVEGMLDALDSVYSSWIRDIELGRGRLIVPEMFLEKDEDGFSFNANREIYTTLDLDPNSAEKSPITANQFAIRTQEHKDTALELIAKIVDSAGYAPQSFGLDISGQNSGTALDIRERKTFITKQKKERYFKTALQQTFKKMMLIDRIHLGNRSTFNEDDLINASFSDTLAHSVDQVAQTLSLINQAQAASIQTKVRMLHTDWTEEEIIEEEQRIMKEQGLLVDDPIEIGGKGFSKDIEGVEE